MVDYEKMYHSLFNAVEKAVNELIKAQQECEELYVSAETTELLLIDSKSQNEEK